MNVRQSIAVPSTTFSIVSPTLVASSLIPFAPRQLCIVSMDEGASISSRRMPTRCCRVLSLKMGLLTVVYPVRWLGPPRCWSVPHLQRWMWVLQVLQKLTTPRAGIATPGSQPRGRLASPPMALRTCFPQTGECVYREIRIKRGGGRNMSWRAKVVSV